MKKTLQYGEKSILHFEAPEKVRITDLSQQDTEPLDDPAAAISSALEAPLDYPPISQATVAGDRIVVVLDPHLPQLRALTSGVIHTLVAGGSDPSNITIVYRKIDSRTDANHVIALVDDSFRDQITILEHDPSDSSNMAYLASTERGDPIYLNRAICDADVVIPVCMCGLDPSLVASSIHASIIASFSDEQTMARFAKQLGDARNIDEVAWLLGLHFTVQVIPGPGESVLHVLAGESREVASKSQQLCRTAWCHTVPQTAGLVVATIDGGQQQQTWENLFRALSIASRVVDDGGAIAVCTEICKLPNVPVTHVLESADEYRTNGYEPTDSLIPESCAAVRVYLLSDLSEGSVEDLGIAHVASGAEINRLVRQYDSCILVASAQHSVLVAEGD